MIKRVLFILIALLVLPLTAETERKELPNVSFFMSTGGTVFFIYEDNTEQLFLAGEGGLVKARDGKSIPGYEDLKLVKSENLGFVVTAAGKEYYIPKRSVNDTKTGVQRVMIKPFTAESEKLDKIMEKLFKESKINYALKDTEDIKLNFTLKSEESLDLVLDKLLSPIDYTWEYKTSEKWVVIKKKPETKLLSKIFFLSENVRNRMALAEQLKDNIKPLLSAQGSVKIMPEGGSLYVKDTDENMKVIEEMIRKMMDK